MLQVKYDELAAKKGEVVDGELGVFNFPVTRVTEKIPGFDGNASGKEETKDDIPLSVEERRAPLKEKSENVLSSESIAAKLEGSCDQPNDLVKALDEKEVFYSADRDKYHEKMLTYVSEKKKPKKSVRMMETVAVQDCNGKVEETLLKHEVEKNKIPKKKIHKKMTAPVVKIENSEEAGECKQQ
ncbi:hypothetical protein SK128_025988 [Halocaridina rubra]|uniref:Uncharacterized protein n=1 Tax=Halocaridina rubra TaxID=373956 RepID=A0AAN8XJ88_HALRR